MDRVTYWLKESAGPFKNISNNLIRDEANGFAPQESYGKGKTNNLHRGPRLMDQTRHRAPNHFIYIILSLSFHNRYADPDPAGFGGFSRIPDPS